MARNKGAAVCTSRRTVELADLKALVLGALRTRLMAPEVYAAFVRAFTAEWNREQGERSTERDGSRTELKRLERSIANFVRAVGESGGLPSLLAELKKAEDRKAMLEAELAVAEAPAPRLMPNLDALYREKVAALQEALAGEDGAAARERVRALIVEVRLVAIPHGCESASIDRGGVRLRPCWGWIGVGRRCGVVLERPMDVVAGAGFEPAAFRL